MAASNNQNRIPLLVVAGPTATGKSALAVALAKLLSGEVVSADSMQIYKGLDIGTAKPTQKERGGIPHHLIDIAEPQVPYSVANYHKDAVAAIADIYESGKTPILCGGTGFYISTLVEGFRFGEQTASQEVREKLNRDFDLDGAALFERLRRLDPQYAEKIHSNDKKRVVRALEMYEATGQTPTKQAEAAALMPNPYSPLTIVLQYADRKKHYAQIEKRADEMLERGLVDEARYVYENRAIFKTAAQAIGYKEFFDYFENKDSLEACVLKLKQATRRYAKRQTTWFSREKNAFRLNIDELTELEILEAVKKEWNKHPVFVNI